MTTFFFLLGILQCAFIWLLGRAGKKLREAAEIQLAEAEQPGQIWPPCALIVPVAGCHASMEAALSTLCEQDYPDLRVIMVSSEDEEEALPLLEKLRGVYPAIQHVSAPLARHCAQKNANLLAALENVPEDVEIFAFCDSTHLARPDFLRCLVLPLARHEASFSTGYHQVVPQDARPVTLAYALTVCFMRLLQGLSAFTQPWGGAMAMTREAFLRNDIRALWESAIVDDCSLAALLQKRGIQPRLCPGALLLTWTKRHPFRVWQAWLERQILFLKFCIRPQWLALGALSLFMLLPAVWGAWSILGGLFNFGSATAAFLALCWFVALAWALLGWNSVLPPNIPFWRWLPAFFMATAMFAKVYASTIPRDTMLWHNIEYLVAPGGKVEEILRKPHADSQK